MYKNTDYTSPAIAGMIPEQGDRPKVVYRMAGDSHLLVEYGEMILDLNLRFRIYSLEHRLQEMEVDGIKEYAPGVRSLLIKYDGAKLPLNNLLKILQKVEENLPPVQGMVFSSRIVHLPLAFHDRWTLDAIQKYMQSVRAEAPYLPDNVDFVARCNALDSHEQVLKALTGGHNMVLGLGDVYLGAPCAVPLDPRNRLVVPKYNPARIYTPEGGVGIGGAYICIYPMESPGGYQLVGRTLPIWNTWQETAAFKEYPWLLRIFDRIQFEAVSEEELQNARENFQKGKYNLKIEEAEFNVGEYNKFINSCLTESEAFKTRQKQASLQWTEGY